MAANQSAKSDGRSKVSSSYSVIQCTPISAGALVPNLFEISETQLGISEFGVESSVLWCGSMEANEEVRQRKVLLIFMAWDGHGVFLHEVISLSLAKHYKAVRHEITVLEEFRGRLGHANELGMTKSALEEITCSREFGRRLANLFIETSVNLVIDGVSSLFEHVLEELIALFG